MEQQKALQDWIVDKHRHEMVVLVALGVSEAAASLLYLMFRIWVMLLVTILVSKVAALRAPMALAYNWGKVIDYSDSCK